MNELVVVCVFVRDSATASQDVDGDRRAGPTRQRTGQLRQTGQDVRLGEALFADHHEYAIFIRFHPIFAKEVKKNLTGKVGRCPGAIDILAHQPRCHWFQVNMYLLP